MSEVQVVKRGGVVNVECQQDEFNFEVKAGVARILCNKAFVDGFNVGVRLNNFGVIVEVGVNTSNDTLCDPVSGSGVVCGISMRRVRTDVDSNAFFDDSWDIRVNEAMRSRVTEVVEQEIKRE